MAVPTSWYSYLPHGRQDAELVSAECSPRRSHLRWLPFRSCRIHTTHVLPGSHLVFVHIRNMILRYHALIPVRPWSLPFLPCIRGDRWTGRTPTNGHQGCRASPILRVVSFVVLTNTGKVAHCYRPGTLLNTPGDDVFRESMEVVCPAGRLFFDSVG